jgi:hypothetical protein
MKQDAITVRICAKTVDTYKNFWYQLCYLLRRIDIKYRTQPTLLCRLAWRSDPPVTARVPEGD